MLAPHLDGAVELIEPLPQTLVRCFTDIHNLLINDRQTARFPAGMGVYIDYKTVPPMCSNAVIADVSPGI
jgi:hypothetical protein